MLMSVSNHKFRMKWLASCTVVLLCFVIGGNCVPACSQYFVSVSFDEYKTCPSPVFDVSTNCSISNYDLTISGNAAQFDFSSTGIITCAAAYNMPDADVKDSGGVFLNPWTIYVTLTDKIDKTYTTLTVLVTVKHVNKYPAVLTLLSPTITIPENTSPGTVIGNCTLTDMDSSRSGYNIPHVQITSKNTDLTFAVDADKCLIILTGTLSYAKTQSYLLNLTAYNFVSDEPALMTFSILNITVTPVQRFPPKCDLFNSYVAVPENKTVGDFLTKLECTNYDNTSGVAYYTATSPSVAYFNVSNVTGEIFLMNAVMYDVKNPANNDKPFSVDVLPKGQQSPKTTVTIDFQITDVDNNPPKMTNSTVTTNILSTLPIGSQVVKLNATDTDAPDTINSELTFIFDLICSPDGYIGLQKSTGVLFVTKDLNGAGFPNITCPVSVYSSTKTADKTTSNVIIIITPVNHKPVFDQKAYASNVNESSMISYSVMTVKATDPDNNTLISYSFDPTTSGYPFKIDSTSGVISMNGTVDYETQKSYYREVVATDGGLPPLSWTVPVSIQVLPANEFTPRIISIMSTTMSLSYVSINKYDKPGTLIATANATDGDSGDDGECEFSLEDTSAPFVIAKDTGKIWIGPGVDMLTASSFSLGIIVSDKSKTHVLSSTATLTINVDLGTVNYNDPECDAIGPFTIFPNNPNKGDTIGTLNCSDADPGPNLLFYITDGNSLGLFTMDPSSDRIRVAYTPVEGTYILLITVRDQGFPPRETLVSVQITVKTNLQFLNLPNNISLYENSNATDLIFTVNASGAFGLITFTIDSGNEDNNFNLHPSTGNLRPLFTLDREKHDIYNLKISASSTPLPKITSDLWITVLDKNDNVPLYKATFDTRNVSEALPVNAVISYYTATDLDIQLNAALSYSIVSGNDENKFAYNDASGALTLMGTLNYKKTQIYTLKLGVTDEGTPPLSNTMTLIIRVVPDINDTVAIVPSDGVAYLTFPEDYDVGKVIAVMNASSSDVNQDLTFAITSGDFNNNTAIFSPGYIYLVSSFDRERASSINITTKVTGKNKQTATTVLYITITDVNDNDPVCYNPYFFYVPSRTRLGIVVGVLKVTDADIGENQVLTLTIVAGDSSAFTFNGTTMITATVLEASIKSRYDLVILVADNGTPSRNCTANVTVIIQPEYKMPIFIPKMVTIPDMAEDISPGSLLYNSEAIIGGASERSDKNPGGELRYSIVSSTGPFSIEIDTGQVQLTSFLSYKNRTFHIIIIKAVNAYNISLSDTLNLTFTVIQVNLYDPVFPLPNNYIRINENTAINTYIGRLTATDNDPGLFGTLTYTMSGSTDFKMDAGSSNITVNAVLDFSRISRYTYIVKAVDSAGKNSRTALTELFITLQDTNNNAPKFSSPSYTVSVYENLSNGSVIYSFVANDLDSSSFGLLSYVIISGNVPPLFSIAFSSGVLSLNGSLDFETTTQYNLRVRARDCAQYNPPGVVKNCPSLVGGTNLTIYLIDVNDNPPVFSEARIVLTIKRDLPPLSQIYLVTATDKDSGKNGAFFFATQTPNPYIGIDTITGTVQTISSLQYVTDILSVTMVAIDEGVPPLTGSTTFIITVEPVSNPTTGNYVFNVEENMPIGTAVGTIPKNASLGNITACTISAGNSGYPFVCKINSSQEIYLTTNVTLDREKQQYYQLLITINTGKLDITVIVRVTDLNDNAPVFTPSPLNTRIVENLPAGSTVAKISVTDYDEPNTVNSTVDVAISPYNPPVSTYFAIDQNFVLTVIAPIPYKQVPSISFTVVATDRGNPKMTSTLDVTVDIIPYNNTVNYIPNTSPFFKTCVFPSDATQGDVICQLKASDFGLPTGSGVTTLFYIIDTTSIFSVQSNYLMVSKESYISASTTYFQWVGMDVNNGQSTTSYTALLRLDTFKRNKNLITVKYNTDVGTLRSKLDAIQTILKSLLPPVTNVVIWSTQSTNSATGRRRLLAVQAEASVVVEADQTINDISSIDKEKEFWTADEAMKYLQASSDGTPNAALSASVPAAASVKPYGEEDDSLDTAYIVLIVMGCILFIALIIALIVLIYYCCVYRRKNKPSDTKKLVDKKSGSNKKNKDTFENINTNRSDMPSETVKQRPDPTDPNSDGLPVRPTQAVFVSSSYTGSKPAKNSTTMLESLEEEIDNGGAYNSTPA